VPALSDRNLFLVAVILYGVSLVYSVFLWRRGFRKDDRINYLLLAAAYGFHFLAMLKRGYSLQRCPTNNLYEATIFFGWAMMTAYLGLGLLRRFRFLGVFASPVMFGLGVFALMPSLDPPPQQATYVGPALSLHAAFTLLAYGAFGLASVAAIMYLRQEQDLKQHKGRILFSLLPPIGRLEKIITWLAFTGLVFLSAGLLVGFVAITPPPGVKVGRDFKVIWSLLVWGLYLALLTLHWGFAQRGRRFACAILGVFGFVLLTYWGANLASPLHNP
jgi:ABC-type uncharacterized transport system permease subunit